MKPASFSRPPPGRPGDVLSVMMVAYEAQRDPVGHRGVPPHQGFHRRREKPPAPGPRGKRRQRPPNQMRSSPGGGDAVTGDHLSPAARPAAQRPVRRAGDRAHDPLAESRLSGWSCRGDMRSWARLLTSMSSWMGGPAGRGIPGVAEGFCLDAVMERGQVSAAAAVTVTTSSGQRAPRSRAPWRCQRRGRSRSRE